MRRAIHGIEADGPSLTITTNKEPIMYLVAILLPPLAVLICGKPIQAVLNLILTLCFYVPGLIHAIMVVSESKADKRAARQTQALAAAQRKG
jgi:uncharacterized membrane protein YqaE (UPF0057 family)